MNRTLILLTALAATVLESPAYAELDQKQHDRDLAQVKALVGKGSPKEAIASWERKKAVYGGTDGHYEHELGNLYAGIRDYKKAEAAYLSGVQLGKKYPPLYIGLSYLYSDQKMSAEAEKWAKRAVEEYPKWWVGYFTLGHLDWTRDNFTGAKHWLRKSIEVEPQASAHWLLAIVSYELKEYPGVVSEMEAAISRDRTYLADKQGMQVAAVSLAQLGRFADAYGAVNTLKQKNKDITDADLRPVIAEIKRLETKKKK